MPEPADFYFAQITDLHVGGRGFNPPEADRYLHWALDELAGLAPRPDFVLATADLVCGGTEAELLQYLEQVDGCTLPIYALPANHDLWGQEDDEAWRELLGPVRQSFDSHGVRFILWNDIQRRADGDGWKAELRPEQREWLAAELEAAAGPVVVGQHCPTLPTGGGYHDQWRDSNADDLLDLLAGHSVLAMLSGHWHRNAEWTARGVRVINTGALAGWQYTGTPPHYCFPTRPGYRLCCMAGGQLRTFWRDGSYWSRPALKNAQVTLEKIGPAHTGGPRPQVRAVEVTAAAPLCVQTWAPDLPDARPEWSLERERWRPMELAFDGLWSDWRAELDPAECRALGEHVCVVRLMTADGPVAYDAVPVRLSERECSAATVCAHAGREQLFDLFYEPR